MRQKTQNCAKARIMLFFYEERSEAGFNGWGKWKQLAVSSLANKGSLSPSVNSKSESGGLNLRRLRDKDKHSRPHRYLVANSTVKAPSNFIRGQSCSRPCSLCALRDYAAWLPGNWSGATRRPSRISAHALHIRPR